MSVSQEDLTDLTEILVACGRGETDAFDRLVPKVYSHLQRVARAQLGRRPRDTMDTSGLVHDAYLRLAGQDGINWTSRGHFFAAAAQAMRHILVDASRRRLSLKRGQGERPAPLSEEHIAEDQHAADVVAVHQALDQLARIDEQLRLVVECRFFAGLSGEETAEALGVAPRTAHRYWLRAKVWLETLLEDDSVKTGALRK